MSKKVSLVGVFVNGMKVIGEERGKNYKCYLNMICHCGKECKFREDYVKTSRVKSCGCIPRKYNDGTHGDSKSKLYGAYRAMINRCYNKNTKNFNNYGFRGIKVCDEWLGQDGYINFKEWALENGYKENNGLSLDRIDVNGNYCPQNCRYTDMKTQARNKSNNWYEYYEGEKRLVLEICEELNLRYGMVLNRKHRGWKSEDLFKNL